MILATNESLWKVYGIRFTRQVVDLMLWLEEYQFSIFEYMSGFTLSTTQMIGCVLFVSNSKYRYVLEYTFIFDSKLAILNYELECLAYVACIKHWISIQLRWYFKVRLKHIYLQIERLWSHGTWGESKNSIYTKSIKKWVGARDPTCLSLDLPLYKSIWL